MYTETVGDQIVPSTTIWVMQVSVQHERIDAVNSVYKHVFPLVTMQMFAPEMR